MCANRSAIRVVRNGRDAVWLEIVNKLYENCVANSSEFFRFQRMQFSYIFKIITLFHIFYNYAFLKNDAHKENHQQVTSRWVDPIFLVNIVNITCIQKILIKIQWIYLKYFDVFLKIISDAYIFLWQQCSQPGYYTAKG